MTENDKQLTWSELKKQIEASGVKDKDEIFFLDINGIGNNSIRIIRDSNGIRAYNWKIEEQESSDKQAPVEPPAQNAGAPRN